MMDRRRTARDRRRAARTSFVASVKQRRAGKVALALAQNLCETGMELRRPAEELNAAGSTMAFSFELPDGGELVEARGTIVFEQSQGAYQRAGVRFTEINRRDRRRISKLVQRTRTPGDRRR